MLTVALPIHDSSIAPPPAFKYYTRQEIADHKFNGFTVAAVDTSYDKFMTAHCVDIDFYNEAIDIFTSESEG